MIGVQCDQCKTFIPERETRLHVEMQGDYIGRGFVDGPREHDFCSSACLLAFYEAVVKE